MGRNLKTCAWCHKPTSMPEVFAAETPLLEWFEEKINKYCEDNDIDTASVGPLINKSLKEKLQLEAEKLNLIEKSSTATLPL